MSFIYCYYLRFYILKVFLCLNLSILITNMNIVKFWEFSGIWLNIV